MQSARKVEHLAALEQLEKQGHVYPCYCTRKELRSLAGAPHIDDMGAPYPYICRDLSPTEQLKKKEQAKAQGRGAALRLRCPYGADSQINFNDLICGEQVFDLHTCGGDFALRRSDGVLAYQLVVVVDDAAQGITHVVRGNDILSSTPRQILLCNLLGLAAPNYAHVPLLCNEKGERLAKRHESLSIRSLRASGVKAESIIGLLAYLAGLRESIRPLYAKELIKGFSFENCKFFTSKQNDNIIVKDDYLKHLF